MNVKEGKVKKGGINTPPTTPRPEPPKGQGISHAQSQSPEKEKVIKKLLWDFLMECLKVHHLQQSREFKTIPNVQDKYTSAILALVEGKE